MLVSARRVRLSPDDIVPRRDVFEGDAALRVDVARSRPFPDRLTPLGRDLDDIRWRSLRPAKVDVRANARGLQHCEGDVLRRRRDVFTKAWPAVPRLRDPDGRAADRSVGHPEP